MGRENYDEATKLGVRILLLGDCLDHEIGTVAM
jgi:hypothetical protein